MKIGFVINEIKYSGAAKIISWLANRLAEDGNIIAVITFAGEKDFYKIHSKIERIKINLKCDNKILKAIKVIKELRKLFHTKEFDVVISFLPTESFYSIIASLFLNIPIVVAERSDPYYEKSLMANLGRFCYRFSEGVIFQTEGAREYFCKCIKGKSQVIPNPAFETTTKIIPYDERQNKIAHSARLYIKQKRQDVLLKAFEIVTKQKKDVTLHIYGDGPDEVSLRELADSLGIADRVIFEGKVNDVETKISDSKLFVLSSDYEGIPNAIIESLSVGVPVVSTDCSPGGARVLIQDAVNGYVVQRNDEEAIAGKMLLVLNNESKARDMSLEALRIIDTFSEDTIYDMWKYSIKELSKNDGLVIRGVIRQ